MSQAELDGYKAQLAQVELTLRADPAHAASLQLRVKLRELVELYTQLLGGEEEEAGQEAGRGGEGADGADLDERAGIAAVDSSSWPFPVGTVCEFKSPDGQWYPVGVVGGDGGDAPTVRFFGFGQNKTVSFRELRAMPPLAAGFLSPVTVQDGLDCEAKYYADGVWYAARVQKVTKDAQLGDCVQVLFTKYGNVEEVPLGYLRVSGSAAASSSSSAAASSGKDRKRSSSSSVAAASSLSASALPAKKKHKIMAIPDKLLAKEGDTDKERDAKRKRMRAIKSKNRFAKMEMESIERQSSWQSFHKKKTKKLVRKGYSSTSIFASTGKKVGHGATGRR